MDIIEIIRGAQAGDLEPFKDEVEQLCCIAYERREAFHYLSTHMTQDMRDVMVSFILARSKLVPHKNGNFYNYQTWEIDIPNTRSDRIIMSLGFHMTLNVWQIGVFRFLCAIAWVWCQEEEKFYAGQPEGVEPRPDTLEMERLLSHTMWTIDAQDLLEAQTHINRCLNSMRSYAWHRLQEGDRWPSSITVDRFTKKWDRAQARLSQLDAVRLAFAQVFLELWMGTEDKTLHMNWHERREQPAILR